MSSNAVQEGKGGGGMYHAEVKASILCGAVKAKGMRLIASSVAARPHHVVEVKRLFHKQGALESSTE